MHTSFLLDTHTLVWFLSGNQSLSKKAKAIILDSSNSCFISIASLWEIAIKINLEKLKIAIGFSELPSLLFNNDIEILQISFEYISELITLESIHKDPFDRIIISQSKKEKITWISKDQNFTKYKGLEVLW